MKIGLLFFNSESTNKQSVTGQPNKLQTQHMSLEYWHLTVSYLFYDEAPLYFTVTGGIGPSFIEFDNHLFNTRLAEGQDTQTSYNQYSGSNWSQSVSLKALYKLNEIWFVGIKVSYINGETLYLKDLNNQKISNSSFQINGTHFEIFTGFSLI